MCPPSHPGSLSWQATPSFPARHLRGCGRYTACDRKSGVVFPPPDRNGPQDLQSFMRYAVQSTCLTSLPSASYSLQFVDCERVPMSGIAFVEDPPEKSRSLSICRLLGGEVPTMHRRYPYRRPFCLASSLVQHDPVWLSSIACVRGGCSEICFRLLCGQAGIPRQNLGGSQNVLNDAGCFGPSCSPRFGCRWGHLLCGLLEANEDGLVVAAGKLPKLQNTPFSAKELFDNNVVESARSHLFIVREEEWSCKFLLRDFCPSCGHLLQKLFSSSRIRRGLPRCGPPETFVGIHSQEKLVSGMDMNHPKMRQCLLSRRWWRGGVGVQQPHRHACSKTVA